MVTTTHKYLDAYPFQQPDTRMILGTIHPHLTDDFRLDYYYGNRGSFWDILACAFPHHDFSTLASIRAVLRAHGVFVTDIIRACERAHERVTQDAQLTRLALNTTGIREALRTTGIDTIYFTSRFGRNSAAALFMRAFGINYKPLFDEATSEVEIPARHFGRPIRGVVLYSPSG